MKFIYYFPYLFLFCLISCEKSNKITEVNYLVSKTIDNFGDSIFLSQVSDLQTHKDKLYFRDDYLCQVISLYKDFSLNFIVGQKGEGSDDFISLSTLNVTDSIISQLDGARSRFLYYDLLGNIIGNYTIPSEENICALINRFVITPFRSYVGVLSQGESAFAEVDMKTHKYNSFGNRFSFDNTTQDRIRNIRHILKWNDQYVCVSDNIPIIEIYDSKSKEKTGVYNYSHISEVRSRLTFAERQMDNKSNSYYQINGDAYIYNDKLYILLMHHLDNVGYSVNKILEIELSPTIKATNIFRLPERGYSNFCVSGDSIYAFNILKSQIELLVK